MARPKKTNASKRRHVLSIRVDDAMLAELKASALVNGRASAAEEVLSRVVDSVTIDQRLGGQHLAPVALLLASRFATAGAEAAWDRFGVDTPASKWLQDQQCFDAGALAVVTALWTDRPDNSKASTITWVERLKSRILARWLNEKGARK